MRAPANPLASLLGRLAILAVALVTTIIATIPAMADEPDGIAADAGADKVAILSSYLSSSMLRVSADVGLVAGNDEAIESVVGSFAVHGLVCAVTSEGEAMLVAVSPRTLANGLAEGVDEPATFDLPEVISYDGSEYSLAAIGPRAFAGCAVGAVVISTSVESVDPAAFESSLVASIEVAEGNPAYSSYDGMLFDAEQTSLLLIPEGKQGAAHLPSTAEVVDPSSFSHSAGASAIDVEAGSAAFSSRNGCLYDASGEVLLWAPLGAAGSQTLGGGMSAAVDSFAEGRSSEQLVRIDAAGGTLEVRALHAASGGFSNDAVFDREVPMGSWASISFELPSLHASTTTKSGYGGMWLMGPYTVTMLDGSKVLLDEGGWLLEWSAKRKGYTHTTWSTGGSGPGAFPLPDSTQLGAGTYFSNWGAPYTATFKDPKGCLYAGTLGTDGWLPDEDQQGVSELTVRWDGKGWMAMFTEAEEGTVLTSVGGERHRVLARSDEMSFLGWRSLTGEVNDGYSVAIKAGEEYTATYGKPYKAELDANGGAFDIYSELTADPDALLESGASSHHVRWDDRGPNAFLHWGNEAWLHYRTADSLRGVRASRTGYLFAGWRKDNGPDAGEKPKELVKGGSYEATWSPIKYSIRYLDRAGNVRDVGQATYDSPGTFSLRGVPDWVSGGYAARGWARAPEQGKVTHQFGQGVANLTEDHGANVDFCLVETVNVNSISYDPAGGSLSSGTPVSYTVEDAAFELPVPTRYGYQFDGWDVSGAQGAGVETVTGAGGVKATRVKQGTYGDLACTARWTLRYDLDVPVADPGSVTFEADSLTGQVRVKSGTSADGELRSYMAVPVALDSLACEGLDSTGRPDVLGGAPELEAIFGAGSVAKVRFTATLGEGDASCMVKLTAGGADSTASLARLSVPAATSHDTPGRVKVSYGLELDPGLAIPPARDAAPVARLIWTVSLLAAGA